jgi:hypothetical protein
MKESQLSPEQQKVHRQEQQALLGQHVAPATPYDKQMAESKQQQLDVDQWTLKESRQVQGYIDQILAKGGKLADLTSVVPEAYQMKVAEALGFGKEFAEQRATLNAPAGSEDFKAMETFAKQEADLMDQLDPTKGGKDDYVTVPASTVKRMRDAKAKEFGSINWWPDSQDNADERANEYITKVARPVGETEQQALGRDAVTGELFAFYIPKDAFVEERHDALREQLADIRASRRALSKKIAGRTVPQDTAQAKPDPATTPDLRSQPEPATPEQVALPESMFGGPWEEPPSDLTYDNLVDVTQQALMGGLVDPTELEKELTDPQIRLELMKAYNATPEQLDQILRMIVGLGDAE